MVVLVVLLWGSTYMIAIITQPIALNWSRIRMPLKNLVSLSL